MAFLNKVGWMNSANCSNIFEKWSAIGDLWNNMQQKNNFVDLNARGGTHNRVVRDTNN
jgi:hypothetical protein